MVVDGDPMTLLAIREQKIVLVGPLIENLIDETRRTNSLEQNPPLRAGSQRHSTLMFCVSRHD
jgi:hypothetical protein